MLATPPRRATIAASAGNGFTIKMSEGRLLIGQRRYSSWSLRGWLAVRLAGLDVTIEVARFERAGITPLIAKTSPNGLVPYLEHRGARVWESLAVCDYCAEIEPALWPPDRIARAHARSIAAEMHAGFRALRQNMWMNLGRDFSGLGRTPEALEDVARIEASWANARQLFGASGPYLFGAAFTAADVMYAPVMTRLLTWLPEISAATRAYVDAVRAHPLIVEWYHGAAQEPADWLVEEYERAPVLPAACIKSN
jgi:glutathione S-transferase